jgi:hypothetical protein
MLFQPTSESEDAVFLQLAFVTNIKRVLLFVSELTGYHDKH